MARERIAAETDGQTEEIPEPSRDRIRVPKTAELVAQRIRRQIIRGEIDEGGALRPESELMEEFGVSRPTLREAFRILESESLISVTRGVRGGARVHAPDIATAARYAGLYLQYHRATLADVQATRELIEPPAARLLAERRDLKATRALREIVQSEQEHSAEPAAFAELSTQFHERVAEWSGSETLAFVVGMLGDIIQRHAQTSIENYANPKLTRIAIRSHEKLIKLVEAGDAEGAEAHWRLHIQGANRSIMTAAGRKSVVDLFD